MRVLAQGINHHLEQSYRNRCYASETGRQTMILAWLLAFGVKLEKGFHYLRTKLSQEMPGLFVVAVLPSHINGRFGI